MADLQSLFSLEGLKAVVTGAASGLSQAIAVGFATYGADVIAADVNEEGLKTTVERITATGRKGVGVRCDISQANQVEELFKTVDQTFGKIDILVNGPYAFTRSKPEDLTLDQWERAIAICLTGFFMCSQEAGKRMIRQGTGGNIISIGSIGGVSALGRGNFVYSIAKSGVHQMTRELATEWAQHHIRVNALIPAQMLTPSVKTWLNDPKTDPNLVAHLLKGIPMNRLGEADDIIGPAIFLASDAAAFVTGVLLPVDGGNLAMNPGGSHTWF